MLEINAAATGGNTSVYYTFGSAPNDFFAFLLLYSLFSSHSCERVADSLLARRLALFFPSTCEKNPVPGVNVVVTEFWSFFLVVWFSESELHLGIVRVVKKLVYC